MLRINLLPEEMRRKEAPPVLQVLTFIIGLLICAGLAVLCSHTVFFSIPKVQEQIDQLNAQIQQIGDVETRKNNLIAQKNQHAARKGAVDSIKREKILWAQWMDYFSDVMPDRVWIENLQIQPGPSNSKAILLRCYAEGDDENQPQDYLEAFQDNCNLNPSFRQRMVLDGQGRVVFEVPSWDLVGPNRIMFSVTMYHQPRT